MDFWFVSSSEIPLREQIVNQISLGVLSGELAPGAKLPGIRSFARRFHMHANTVSAAYRQLHADKLVVLRKGSGVYVNPSLKKENTFQDELQPRVALLLNEAAILARQAGFKDTQVYSLLASALSATKNFVLVEADAELARTACFEIESAGRQAPVVCPLSPECFGKELSEQVSGRTPVFFASKAGAAREVLGESASIVILNINSPSASLVGHLPRSREHLVAVVSSWSRFTESARSMLISCGFDSDALLVRDANLSGWEVGLDQVAAVVCDSLTRVRLPKQANAFVFNILSVESINKFPKR